MSREDWPELELEGRWEDMQVGLKERIQASSESQERAALTVALGSIKKSSLFLSHNGTFHKRTHMDSRYVPQGVIEGWSRAGIITKSGRQHRFYLIEPAPNQAWVDFPGWERFPPEFCINGHVRILDVVRGTRAARRAFDNFTP